MRNFDHLSKNHPKKNFEKIEINYFNSKPSILCLLIKVFHQPKEACFLQLLECCHIRSLTLNLLLLHKHAFIHSRIDCRKSLYHGL